MGKGEEIRSWDRVALLADAHTLSLESQLSYTQTCASELADVGLSRPIAAACSFSRARKQISPYLKHISISLKVKCSADQLAPLLVRIGL